MCGICGIVKTDSGKPFSSSLISSMCQTIIHRGPDDQGIYTDQNACLGVRRLSIIDVIGGHQPLSNENKSVWIAYNGEVYNFPSLRKELIKRGHTFRTKTDTETIIHGYEEWGENIVNKLQGMYAFSIWDKKNKKMLLVRDRIGIKPLYYTVLEDQTLVFGSELKTILAHPDVKRSLQPQALDLFLTLEYIPAPYSAFKNIFKLPAGHSLIYKNGQIKIKKYWDIQNQAFQSEMKGKSLSFFMDRLYELLKNSVKMRLISDVPLGAFLSGGIDSSSIVGLMHQSGVSSIKTFSIGFEDSSYNELSHAWRIVRQFQTNHEEFIIKPDALELSEKLIHHLDEPFGDFSIFPTYLVSKMARNHVKAILSGDGGDELFGGYEHYQAQKISKIPFSVPLGKSFSKLLKKFPPSSKKKGLWNIIRRYCQGLEISPELNHFRWMMFLSQESKKQLYTQDLFAAINGNNEIHTKKPLQDIFSRLEQFDPVNRELYLDMKTYLVDNILVKVDRMSMAASLETRVPLIDHKIAEFLFSLPGHFKIKGFQTKWLFKKTMERLLPPENIYRKKEGFSIPIKHWLRTDLKDFMLDHLNEKRISEDGLFNYNYIKKMIDLHLEGKQNYSHQLWALLVFEIWKKQYL
ncbi:MAG: asparagine synthase (glutamine-hydrolyzing) [Candidatus Aminicenantaceae bacterium]